MYAARLLLLLVPLSAKQINLPKHEISLPFRPVASKQVSTINFITRVITLRKQYNLRAHHKYFDDIVSLWTAIFMEPQLTMNHEEPSIMDTNPECRDLRAIVMDAIKSVSELLNANFFIRTKRDTSHSHTLYNKSASISIKLNHHKKKRSFLVSSALSLMGGHLAKQALKNSFNGFEINNNNKGLIPIGGSILAMAFGVARKEEVNLNRRKMEVLSNQFIKLQQNQNKFEKFANLTQLVLGEMHDLITRNDIRITNLFNETRRELKKNSRGIICLQLYSESIYMIEAVKTSINNFIMADTLIPKGNKNLFSEVELNNMLTKFPDFRSAAHDRNFWDYSLFNIKKEGDQWTYEIQVPLTNLPTFTMYKVSPFPVFPIGSSTSSFTVDIPVDSSVILSNDDKYFIDKVYKERCTYSDTHGICPGPVGLIDTDLCSCKESLLMHETNRMDELCNFKRYDGHTPRIATSMGKFIITAKKGYSFKESCNNSHTMHEILPGTTMLTIQAGCTLNTTDIMLLNPNGVEITNQKIHIDRDPIFKFIQQIKIKKDNIVHSDSGVQDRITNLELEHIDDTEFNRHFESNSKIYIILIIIVITLMGAATALIYFKITLITPVINLMRKVWSQKSNVGISNI